MIGSRSVRWFVAGVAASAGLAAAASASVTQAERKTWIWRGTATMDVTHAVSEFGLEHGFRYRFQIVYPGRWVPGHNRSVWRGTLTWQFDGYSDRGPTGLNCTYHGSGGFPVQADIYIGGGEGERTALAVTVYPHHAPQDGQAVGKVVRSCAAAGFDEERHGREAFEFLPVVTSVGLGLPPRTKSFVRTVETPVSWLSGTIYRVNLPMRIALKDVSRTR